MNTVHIELNSYTQEVRFFVNGVQTDPYSSLSNFTYAQVLQDPAEILEAVSRELNDDFELELTATDWEYKKIEDVAFDFEDCCSCSARQPAIDLSSRERAERLGDHLPEQTFTVLASASLPQTRHYGNLTLCFTGDPAQATHKDLARQQDIASAAETLLINPAIGSAAKAAGAKDSSFAVCYSLSPVLTVSFPRNIQAGDQVHIRVAAFPESESVPVVSVRSSNPDIASVSGTVIHAHNSGITNIQVFLPGQNAPFHSQKIRVEKNVYVSRIDIPALNGSLPEGQTVSLDIVLFPPDASDADQLHYYTSDPDIAQFMGNQLRLNASGECEIVITGKKVFYSKTIQVSARLRKYILSVTRVELNLGQRKPVSVRCVPEFCHNSAYSWSTDDKTVAVIVEEDGQQYIKAIGMGRCTLTCRSSDRSVSATCAVTVKSAMYESKRNRNIFALLGFTQSVSSPENKLLSDAPETEELTSFRTVTPVDAFADLECRFSGENGQGTVTVTNHSAHPFLQDCIFTACPADGLTNGQQIAVLVGSHAASRKHPGYQVERTSMLFTVSGLRE